MEFLVFLSKFIESLGPAHWHAPYYGKPFLYLFLIIASGQVVDGVRCIRILKWMKTLPKHSIETNVKIKSTHTWNLRRDFVVLVPFKGRDCRVNLDYGWSAFIENDYLKGNLISVTHATHGPHLLFITAYPNQSRNACRFGIVISAIFIGLLSIFAFGSVMVW